MGIRNVSLSSIVPQLNSGYSLYGENFTKYSRVYVNGEKQKSSFLNNTRINLSETELKDGDVIQVDRLVPVIRYSGCRISTHIRTDSL